MVWGVKECIVVTHLSLGPSNSLEVRGLRFSQRCWWILSLRACDVVSTGKWRFGRACFLHPQCPTVKGSGLSDPEDGGSKLLRNVCNYLEFAWCHTTKQAWVFSMEVLHESAA